MKRSYFIVVLLYGYITATAQHSMGNMDMETKQSKMPSSKKITNGQDTTTPLKPKPISIADTSMRGMDMGGSPTAIKMNMSSMNSAYSLNLPMSRDGSGTGWVPNATPMYGVMVHTHKWMLMFHGNIFPRYNKQDLGGVGRRGNQLFDAPDMLMAMGQRKVGIKGLFHFSIMMSTDALITGGNGYPLLFQTGESWNGHSLVDRQHPHDLFSELSMSYAHSFNNKTDIFLYVGYPGEPALGPVTFMHRPSGEFMPDAPISHHWSDATHITFGVATLGVRYGKFKLESSSFTGREPDENRYNFDKPRFDSRSARLSYNPTVNWALQASTGFIKSPEQLQPYENVYRTTASTTYVRPLGRKQYITATALWGQNQIPGQNPSNSALTEATLKLNKIAIYMRYEWVQKSVEELTLSPTLYGKNDFLYVINMATVGATYDLFKVGPIIVAGGGQLSVYQTDEKLNNLYGTGPVSGELYLHLYPQMMHKR